jgi:hypothetical protein
MKPVQTVGEFFKLLSKAKDAETKQALVERLLKPQGSVASTH